MPTATATAIADAPAPAPVRTRTLDDLHRHVEEAGADSFPASDPPGWWAGPPT